MFDTYKMMSRINTEEFSNVDLSEIAFRFRESTDTQFRNKCFAHVFKEIWPMLLKLCFDSRYSCINSDDKTEECLGSVLYAMEKWTPSRGQKFSSYIFMNIKTGFLTRINKSNNNKNKIYQKLCNGSSPEVKDYMLNSITYNSSEKLFNYLKDLNSSSILTKDEIKYCQSLLLGYTNNKQIGKRLQPHIKEISKVNKKNKLISKPIESDKDLFSYMAQLRSSIKKKIKANNNSPF